MTAVRTAPPPVRRGLGVSVAQVRILARRSVLGTFRQPQAFMPAIIFPLFIAAVNSAAMGKSIHIPGFVPEGQPPPNSLLDFLLPASVTHGVLFGGITAGADTATDIENGFFDRLLASPVARPNLLIGRLAGAAALGAVQALIFTVVFYLFGVRIQGGLPGFIVLVLYAMILALFVGGFAATLALRTGSAEAVQNFFPLTFILLFVSSAFFPTNLMSGVYRTLAEHNPITSMINGVRYQVIVGFDLSQAVKSLGIAAILATMTIALATAALRRRVAQR